MSERAEETAPFWARAAALAIGLYCAAMAVAVCVYVVARVSAVPVWDSWELYRYAAERPGLFRTLGYYFAAHNEHIIATSKPIHLIDLYVFGARSLFSVACSYVLAVACAVLFSEVAVRGLDFTRLERAALAAGTAACTTSLVQWMNLVWGFQNQFYLLLLGTLATIVLSYLYARPGPLSWASLAGLALAIPFTVFSMGSGVLVALPILLITVALRQDWRRALIPLVLLAISIGIFFSIVPGATKIGDPALRTPYNLLLFFFAVIGAPLTAEIDTAIKLGAAACAAITLFGLFGLLRPWLARRPLDGPTLILFGLIATLAATAAAIAYARVTLGLVPAAAMTSRYATPMLMLWLALGLLGLRALAHDLWPPRALRLAACGACLAVAALATWFNLRPDLRAELNTHFVLHELAAFNLLSGVETDAALAILYPQARAIRPAIAYLRDNRLSVFSPAAASYRASADVVTRDPAAWPLCAAGGLDPLQRVSAEAGAITGWAAAGRRRPPERVYAFAADRRLIGIGAPLTVRDDVARALGSRRLFRGFYLPLNFASSAPPVDSVTVVAAFAQGLGPPCRVGAAVPLPFAWPVTPPPNSLAPLAAAIETSGEIASPGLSPVITKSAYPGAVPRGSYVQGDQSRGAISIAIAREDHACGNVVLPLVRGPTAAGLKAEIVFPDGIVETLNLAALPPHDWVLLEIPGNRICRGGHAAPLKIVVADESAAWGTWIAVAPPARRR